MLRGLLRVVVGPPAPPPQPSPFAQELFSELRRQRYSPAAWRSFGHALWLRLGGGPPGGVGGAFVWSPLAGPSLLLLALLLGGAAILAVAQGPASAIALLAAGVPWLALTLAWLTLHLTMSARPARGGLLLTHPTLLTLLRAMALPLLIAFAVGRAPRGLWVVLLCAYWLLDVLDGQWARRRGQTTLAGTMLDGWVDMGTNIGAGAILSLAGLWPPHLLALLVLRFLVPALVAARSLARGRTVRFRSTVLGKLAGGTMVLASVWPLIGSGPPPLFWQAATLLLLLVLLDQSRRVFGEVSGRDPAGSAPPNHPAVDRQGDPVDIAGGR